MEFKLIKEPLSNEFPLGKPIVLYGMLFELIDDEGNSEYITSDDCYSYFVKENDSFLSIGKHEVIFYPKKIENASKQNLDVIYPIYITDEKSNQVQLMDNGSSNQNAVYGINRAACPTCSPLSSEPGICTGCGGSQGNVSCTGTCGSSGTSCSTTCGNSGHTQCTSCGVRGVTSCAGECNDTGTSCAGVCYDSGTSCSSSCGLRNHVSCGGTCYDSDTYCYYTCSSSGTSCSSTCGNSGHTSCASSCGNSGHTSCVACPTSGLSATNYDINIVVNDLNNIIEVDNIQNVNIDNQKKTVGDLVLYSANKGVASSTAQISTSAIELVSGDSISWDYICQAESVDKGYVKIYRDSSLIKTYTYSGTSVARWSSESYKVTTAGTYNIVAQFIKDSSVDTLSDTFYIKKFYINKSNGTKKYVHFSEEASPTGYGFKYFIKRL